MNALKRNNLMKNVKPQSVVLQVAVLFISKGIVSDTPYLCSFHIT
jgi:hypothetical protein